MDAFATYESRPYRNGIETLRLRCVVISWERDCAEERFGQEPLDEQSPDWLFDRHDFAHNLPGHARLYRVTWSNPWPEVEVRAMDFVSKMTRCSPFLVAATVE